MVTDKKSNEPLYIFKTLASGAIAGAIAKTAIAPLDRVKIHFQVRNPQFSSITGTFSGVFKAVGQIYSSDGIYGLYRGHLAMIVRIIPYSAVNYTAYDQFKKLFSISEGHDGSFLALKRILSGSLSGCTAVTLTYPFDILRARIAYVTLTKEQRHQTYLETLKILCREGQQKHGFRIAGLYQGYVPTILGIIPYAGASFYTFETLKGLYAKYCMDPTADRSNVSIPTLPKLFCGMLAGMCAQTASYPLDVIRRRSQLWRVSGHISPSDTFSVSQTMRLLMDIVKTKGWRELFVGLSINYIKVAPAMGISFVTYEFLKENIFHIK